MPINPDTKIGFIHIPRNGGTFIEHKMGVHLNRKDSGTGGKYNNRADLRFIFGNDLQHLSIHDITSLIGREVEEYKWFAVIRDPLDRLQSVLAHSMNSPEALSSVGNCVRVLFRVFKIMLYQKVFIEIFGLRRQVGVYQSTVQHLKPQSFYIKDACVPINIYPFHKLGELGELLDTGVYQMDKVPNRSRLKPKVHSKTIIALLSLFTFVFYSRDVRLYKRLTKR